MEILLDRDPQAARGKLVELRDLQKDALAEIDAAQIFDVGAHRALGVRAAVDVVE